MTAEAVTALSRSISVAAGAGTALAATTGVAMTLTGAAAGMALVAGRAVAPTKSTSEASPVRFRVVFNWLMRLAIGAFRLHRHRQATRERFTRWRSRGRCLAI